jgi:hypothetical protein
MHLLYIFVYTKGTKDLEHDNVLRGHYSSTSALCLVRQGARLGYGAGAGGKLRHCIRRRDCWQTDEEPRRWQRSTAPGVGAVSSGPVANANGADEIEWG